MLRIFGQNREDGEIYVIVSPIIYRPAVCAVRLGCVKKGEPGGAWSVCGRTPKCIQSFGRNTEESWYLV